MKNTKSQVELKDDVLNATYACRRLSKLLKKDGLTAYKDIEVAEKLLKKAHLKAQEEYKNKSKHEGVTYDKEGHYWRGATRIFNNGGTSTQIEKLTYEDEDKAYEGQQLGLRTAKKAIDKFIKMFKIQKRTILKGHYIDVVDLPPTVTKSADVIKGCFGNMDERL